MHGFVSVFPARAVLSCKNYEVSVL